MSDQEKFIGDPSRPRAPWQREPRRIVSANVNVADEIPEPKEPGERFIGDPLRPRAPWQKPATKIVPQ
jgi:hypothetical protein